MTVAAQLNAICDAQPFVTRFMVRNLLSGEEIGRGENEETPSGSTRKTSIMMAVLKAASEGRLDLDQPVTYEKRLAEEVASGMFRYLTPGIVISLRDALAGMMVLSDNVCTKMVLERLTLEEVDSYCKTLGMANTHHRFLIPPLALAADHPLKTVTTTSAADRAAASDHSPCPVLARGAGKARLQPAIVRLGNADAEKPDIALRDPLPPAVRGCGGEQERTRQARAYGRRHRLQKRRAVFHHHRLYR